MRRMHKDRWPVYMNFVRLVWAPGCLDCNRRIVAPMLPVRSNHMLVDVQAFNRSGRKMECDHLMATFCPVLSCEVTKLGRSSNHFWAPLRVFQVFTFVAYAKSTNSTMTLSR